MAHAERDKLTRNNVAGVHSILILDKPEAVHKLDFGDLAGAMSRKVGFHIGLGCFCGSQHCVPSDGSDQTRPDRTRRQSRDNWTEQVASL